MQSRGSTAAIKDLTYTPQRRYGGDTQKNAFGNLVTTPKEQGRSERHNRQEGGFEDFGQKTEIRVNDFKDTRPENARYGGVRLNPLKSEMPSGIRKANDYDLGEAPLPKRRSVQPPNKNNKNQFSSSPQKNKINVNVNIKEKLNARKYQTNIEQIDEEDQTSNAFMQKASRDRLKTMPAKSNKVEKIAP